MSKVILSCLLLLVAGCPGTIQRSQSNYFFENITLTCAYNTLEEIDGITKVWVYEDSVGFEGKGFYGSVSIKRTLPPPGNLYAYVVVYSEDRYYGLGERPLITQQVKEQIKESLFESCNK